MPLRFLFRYLANNEQLVQRIAESYPVRKAARFCVSIYYRTQNIARESLPPTDKFDVAWMRSFLSRFKDNLSHGIKDAQQQLKDKGKRN
ncbi:protein NCBP2AS2 homolog [Arctopsyche grandis]|uniref:protein NCBP2AS2 homolog n=1 Tax=Arctopsyche grandis TaxID=121162 RepID=UPI00406D94E5